MNALDEFLSALAQPSTIAGRGFSIEDLLAQVETGQVNIADANSPLLISNQIPVRQDNVALGVPPPTIGATTQERVDFLLKNDPNFAKELGIAPDAFNAEQLRKKGTGLPGDTRGGADRVNANTKQFGVTAITDPITGRVTLTNIDPSTGQPTPQSQVFGFSPIGATGGTPGSVSQLLTNLRNSSDAAQARGIMATLRESIAVESARLQQQSSDLAEKRFGVRSLETALAQAEALDRQTPGFIPGMGDSKRTAQIRQQVAQARAQADADGKRALEGNIGFAALKAADLTASTEFKRIEALDSARIQKNLSSEIRQEEKKALLAEKTSAAFDSLSEAQKNIALRLNPALRASINSVDGVDAKAKVVNFIQKQATSDPFFKEVMQANPSDLLALAVKGNPRAAELVTQDEQAATNRTPESIAGDFARIRSLVDSPNLIKDFATEVSRGSTDPKKAREAVIANFNKLSLEANTKEELRALADRKLQIALQLDKKNKGLSFLQDLSALNFQEPEIVNAISEARRLRGSADIQTVLASMTANLPGPEALQKIAAFQASIENAVRSTAQKSIFGSPDLAIVRASIAAEAAKHVGVRALFAPLRAAVSSAPSTPSLLSAPLTASKFLVDTINGTQTKPINPITGLPFGQ